MNPPITEKPTGYHRKWTIRNNFGETSLKMHIFYTKNEFGNIASKMAGNFVSATYVLKLFITDAACVGCIRRTAAPKSGQGTHGNSLSYYNPSMTVVPQSIWIFFADLWKYMMTSSNGNISALLALCAVNPRWRSLVNSLHKSQWRGTLTFSLIFAWLNTKQSWGWRFDTQSRSLRHHCNVWLVYICCSLMLGVCVGNSLH